MVYNIFNIYFIFQLSYKHPYFRTPPSHIPPNSPDNSFQNQNYLSIIKVKISLTMSASSPSSEQTSVQVILRLQPPATDTVHLIDSHTVHCLNKQYTFDHVFPHAATQDHIFDKVGLKMLACARKGYNSCIFVYGQTGSGKTYTMTGTEGEDGLVQKCVRGLVRILEGFESYELKMSYFEIYNEQVNDLLVFSNGNKRKQKGAIKIKQSLTQGFYLQNLTECQIENQHQLIECLERGLRNRTTAATQMNKESSRSHSILTLNITTRERKLHEEGYSIKTSKVHFVDLAGSEKQKATMSTGDRLKQASSINKSLTSLSIVIQKLSAKATHIPYRDSVITKILRDSLGGNSKTILIATLSSKEECISETISTLNFASKAKKVKLAARVNEEYDGSPTQMRKKIAELQLEIKKFRNREHQQQSCQSCEAVKEEYEKLQTKIQFLQEQLVAKNSRIQQLEHLLQQFQFNNEGTTSYHTVDQFHESQNTFPPLLQNDLFHKISQEGEYQKYFTSSQEMTEAHCSRLNLQTIKEENSNPDNQVTEISKITFNFSRPARKNNRQQSALSETGLISLGIGQKIKVQSISAEFVIEQLQQRIFLLQNQLQLFKLQQESTKKQAYSKSEQCRRIYEPIIKEWVLQNGKLLKSNLEARNSIHKDIILGLKAKLDSTKQQMLQEHDRIQARQRQYKQLILDLSRRHEQFKQRIIRRQQQQQNYRSKPSKPPQAHLSKSHPRMSSEHASLSRDTAWQQQNSQNMSQVDRPNNTSVQGLQQRLERIQQELDRQQIIKSQLMEQLEDYRYRVGKNQQQLQQSASLVRYWQQKYNKAVQGRNKLEAKIEQVSRLTSSHSEIKQEQQSMKCELVDSEHISNNLHNIGEYSNKDSYYVSKVEHISTILNASSEEMHNLGQDKQQLRRQLDQINNILQNKNNEIANLQTLLTKSYARIEEINADYQQQLQNLEMDNSGYRSQLVSITEQCSNKLNQKQEELKSALSDNAKQYMQLLMAQTALKEKQTELKEAATRYEKMKIENQKCVLRFKDLYNATSNEQSETYKHIQDLNEANRQLQAKAEKLQQRLNYTVEQLKMCRRDLNSWKQKHERQKKWIDEFKKIQDKFMSQQNAAQNQDPSVGKQKPRENKSMHFNGRKTEKFKVDPAIIGNWEVDEAKKQLKEIAEKLADVCGLAVSQDNLVLQLDQISVQLNKIKLLREENESLKAKNKLLRDSRNSSFFKNFN